MTGREWDAGPVITEARRWTLTLPLVAPLSLNDRHSHWATRARQSRDLRDAVCLLARGQRIPALDRAAVRLHWEPRTARTRDGDNAAPTVKAAVDGLRDARVLVDDDVTRVEHQPLAVHSATGRSSRLWLVVTEVTP